MRRPSGRLVLGLAIAAVLLAVAGGLLVLESPAQQRTRRLDERRVSDLREIARAVDLFSTRHDRLPASLDELSRELGAGVAVRDPTTGEPYEYRTLGERSYELCAAFERSTTGQTGWRGRGFWAHGAGRHCFELEARTVRR